MHAAEYYRERAEECRTIGDSEQVSTEDRFRWKCRAILYDRLVIQAEHDAELMRKINLLLDRR